MEISRQRSIFPGNLAGRSRVPRPKGRAALTDRLGLGPPRSRLAMALHSNPRAMRPRSNPWSLIALAFLLLFADLAFGSSGAPGPLAQSPLEEFSFSSPDQVEDYVAQAVRAARKEQPKGDGGSVLAPGSPMFKSAEDSARRRLLYSERPSLYQKKQDLLGGVRASIMQLAGEAGDQAGDPEDPSSSSSASHAETADGGGLVGQYEEELFESFLAVTANATGEGEGGEHLVALRGQAEALLGSVRLADEITQGAISSAGALSPEEAEPLSSVNVLRVPWLAALDIAENSSAEGRDFAGNSTELGDWYSSRMGGKISLATLSQEVGQASPLGILVAEEDVRAGDDLLEMPLKCVLNQLSLRNRRGGKLGFVGEKLKAAFAHNQEWGLAVALLHEVTQHRHGAGSKWGPFLDSLEMRLLGSSVVQELGGTFAAELLKIEEEEVQSGFRWVSSNVCKSDNTGICNRRAGSRSTAGTFTQQDFRWALAVVKQNAVPLRLETTGKEYLSLVPYANLAFHDPAAGGELVLSLSNTVTLRAGTDVPAFHPIKISKGNFTDAEQFLRYHTVSEETNAHNHVRVKIPGGGAAGQELIYKVQTLRDWRRQVGLPPRSSDLWRSASTLNLYGEDEEEQKHMDRQNRLLSGTELEPITRAEELMLTGRVKTREEAEKALMVKQPAGSEIQESKYSESQLYSAPDLEDDISLEMAAKSLKEAAHQLHISVALNATEEGSIGKALNDTRNFFLYGTAPTRGLDALDEMLIKKMDVMDACGQPSDFVIRADGVSDALLCAMRVTFANETELDLIAESFNESMAITKLNEVLTLRSLEGSVRGLLGMHATSADEDEALLDGEDLTPKKRCAVTLRLREKELLRSALSLLEAKIGGVDESDPELYQIAALLLREEEKRRRMDELERKLEEERERLSAKVEVVSVNVNVQKAGQPNSVESVNLTVYQGDSLTDRVREFGAKHELDGVARTRLEAHLKANIPDSQPISALVQAITKLGSVEVLGIMLGENATDKVERFLLMQGILDQSEDEFRDLQEELEGKLVSRSSSRLLVELPVVAPDGRKLALQIRDGEQHDLVEYMRTFAKVGRGPLSSFRDPLLTPALLFLLLCFPAMRSMPSSPRAASSRWPRRLCGDFPRRSSRCLSTWAARDSWC